MKNLILAVLFLISITTSYAQAKTRMSVDSCKTDSYVTSRIQEDIPKEEQLPVFNAKNEQVGAFHYSPADGTLFALYLCGFNSGYYYADGNIYKGVIEQIHNDEYISSYTLEKADDLIKINIQIEFIGDLESADYPTFSTTLYVPLN